MNKRQMEDISARVEYPAATMWNDKVDLDVFGIPTYEEQKAAAWALARAVTGVEPEAGDHGFPVRATLKNGRIWEVLPSGTAIETRPNNT